MLSPRGACLLAASASGTTVSLFFVPLCCRDLGQRFLTSNDVKGRSVSLKYNGCSGTSTHIEPYEARVCVLQ